MYRAPAKSRSRVSPSESRRTPAATRRSSVGESRSLGPPVDRADLRQTASSRGIQRARSLSKEAPMPSAAETTTQAKFIPHDHPPAHGPRTLAMFQRFPFACRKASDGRYGPLLRELVIPFGSAGYVVLFEISGRHLVTILAVRQQRESDYY